MKSIIPQIAIVSFLLAATCAVLVVAAPPFAPEPGLLLLKNGQVIEGGILREGDRYVVSIGSRGEGGELRIPASDVDAVCRTLADAYAHKRNNIAQYSVKPHLELADWCLRNNLYDRAAEELVAAMAIDAGDPKIAALERRLKMATAPKTQRERVEYVLPPTQEEIEAALRTLPPVAVEEFMSNIQPLLLSRCAVTACHGPNSTAEFHLVRPPLKHANKTRETQRNLFATLAQIDPDGDSRLLTQSLAAHGGARAPIFDQQDRRQIEMLATWIEKVKVANSSGTVARQPESFVRPATFEEEVRDNEPAGLRRPLKTGEPRAFQAEPNAKPLNKAEQSTKPTTVKPKAAVRDPFNADIFNQRYHGGK
jgi:hypothetical protein